MALLLGLGFWGTARVADELAIGVPATRLLAATSYALSPFFIARVGNTSVFVQGAALLPWVLLPLVRGARGGSPRRAAFQSGIAILAIGGVNATVVAAVLLVPAIWLLTRERGPRRRSLFGWWMLAVTCATAWWAAALLLQGRYGIDFLPLTERASLTTAPTSPFEVIRGAADWLSHIVLDVPQLPSGWTLVSSGPVVAATGLVSALGVFGLARKDLPERRFLVTTLLIGVALVGAGYGGMFGNPAAPGEGLPRRTRRGVARRVQDSADRDVAPRDGRRDGRRRRRPVRQASSARQDGVRSGRVARPRCAGAGQRPAAVRRNSPEREAVLSRARLVDHGRRFNRRRSRADPAAPRAPSSRFHLGLHRRRAVVLADDRVVGQPEPHTARQLRSHSVPRRGGEDGGSRRRSPVGELPVARRLRTRDGSQRRQLADVRRADAEHGRRCAHGERVRAHCLVRTRARRLAGRRFAGRTSPPDRDVRPTGSYGRAEDRDVFGSGHCDRQRRPQRTAHARRVEHGRTRADPGGRCPCRATRSRVNGSSPMGTSGASRTSAARVTTAATCSPPTRTRRRVCPRGTACTQAVACRTRQ